MRTIIAIVLEHAAALAKDGHHAVAVILVGELGRTLLALELGGVGDCLTSLSVSIRENKSGYSSQRSA